MINQKLKVYTKSTITIVYYKLKSSIFKLFLNDIHIHINFLRRKIQSIFYRLAFLVPNNALPEIKSVFISSNDVICEKNFKSNSEKIVHMKRKNRNETQEFSINKHKDLQKDYRYNNDSWFINLTDKEVPKNVQDLLRLGENFSNPHFVLTFEMLKEV